MSVIMKCINTILSESEGSDSASPCGPPQNMSSSYHEEDDNFCEDNEKLCPGKPVIPLKPNLKIRTMPHLRGKEKEERAKGKPTCKVKSYLEEVGDKTVLDVAHSDFSCKVTAHARPVSAKNPRVSKLSELESHGGARPKVRPGSCGDELERGFLGKCEDPSSSFDLLDPEEKDSIGQRYNMDYKHGSNRGHLQLDGLTSVDSGLKDVIEKLSGTHPAHYNSNISPTRYDSSRDNNTGDPEFGLDVNPDPDNTSSHTSSPWRYSPSVARRYSKTSVSAVKNSNTNHATQVARRDHGNVDKTYSQKCKSSSFHSKPESVDSRLETSNAWIKNHSDVGDVKNGLVLNSNSNEENSNATTSTVCGSCMKPTQNQEINQRNIHDCDNMADKRDIPKVECSDCNGCDSFKIAIGNEHFTEEMGHMGFDEYFELVLERKIKEILREKYLDFLAQERCRDTGESSSEGHDSENDPDNDVNCDTNLPEPDLIRDTKLRARDPDAKTNPKDDRSNCEQNSENSNQKNNAIHSKSRPKTNGASCLDTNEGQNTEMKSPDSDDPPSIVVTPDQDLVDLHITDSEEDTPEDGSRGEGGKLKIQSPKGKSCGNKSSPAAMEQPLQPERPKSFLRDEMDEFERIFSELFLEPPPRKGSDELKTVIEVPENDSDTTLVDDNSDISCDVNSKSLPRGDCHAVAPVTPENKVSPPNRHNSCPEKLCDNSSKYSGDPLDQDYLQRAKLLESSLTKISKMWGSEDKLFSDLLDDLDNITNVNTPSARRRKKAREIFSDWLFNSDHNSRLAVRRRHKPASRDLNRRRSAEFIDNNKYGMGFLHKWRPKSFDYSEDDADSGYHTGNNTLQSTENIPKKSPGEYTLTREQLRKNIEAFNDNNHGLIMSLQTDTNTFQGFIRVHMNLIRPINMSLPARPPSIYEALGQEDEPNATQISSFYLPKDTTKVIHIGCDTTVHEVIRTLLTKFRITDNPRKFALYEKVGSPDDKNAHMRRLSDDETPLNLCLSWKSEGLETHRFILQENDTGEIIWDAFSIPELENFLIILNKEENEYVDQIKAKYQLMKFHMVKLLKDKTGKDYNKTAPPKAKDSDKTDQTTFAGDKREPIFV